MEKIYVTVRPKPLSAEDAKSSPWRISGNSISIANQSTKFDFDRIFREDCKNSEVYEARTRDIVVAAVRGFNGTVFAYGQTNSGKTHTMRGSAFEPGVIPLAVRDLFEIIQEDVDREFLLRMSYMEIYNEEINDLLAPEHRKLQIHESLERGIFVAGLREEIVATPEQVLDLMEFGESHRHIGETNMNVYSSRSHTIFRMIIESRDRTEDEDVGRSCDAVRVSVLNLVDLAGSERAAKTGAEGVRLKEGSHINKSLMTLGTVIKKLSEGAESQGGHVPYRDSKLTRILQPSLGGNANTAIICNITLAQIHADETKSSLQFASRALHVTNCARVNEILTDAALLKRQKKEIEELRARLLGSHSEHFEEEILNLRNTLLQSEVERERIALELQEEKKAQALRERRLEEQAKKIENLSSMVLNSNLDEKRNTSKKFKRRDTWCLGASSLEALGEELVMSRHDLGLLVPFEELVIEEEAGRVDIPQDNCMPDKVSDSDLLEDCILPDAGSLLNVTNRRKASSKKKNPIENKEMVEVQAEYEDLLIEYETQILTRDIEIECLRKMLSEGDSDAHLFIKPLHEQIELLEKFSFQENLGGTLDLAVQQNTYAREKNVQGEDVDSMMELSLGIQTLTSEVQSSRNTVDNISSVIVELFEMMSAVSDLFLELKSYVCESSKQMESVLSDDKKICNCLVKKVVQLESDKANLFDQSIALQKEVQDLRIHLQESDRALMECCEKKDLENAELLGQIGNLEKELSILSSCSLAKEKEILRKEVEKTKVKLKETEFKLKNAVQDKTKLEGEKAQAEREIKQLHSQMALLERDICKRDSFAGRRRESKACDSNRAKVHNMHFEQTMQEEYKKLEVMAFEMETTIASLEEALIMANREKEEASVKNEILASELEVTSNKLTAMNSELKTLQEEVSAMRNGLVESESLCQKMEHSINLLSGEKEELAMQLTDALLELEEERVIWSAKEKASIESIAEKTKSSNTELKLLSEEMLKMSRELDSYKDECKAMREQLALWEENMEQEKKNSMEKSSQIHKLQLDLKSFAIQSEKHQDEIKNQLILVLKERDQLLAENNLQKNLTIEAKADAEELKRRIATMDVNMHNDKVSNNNEKAKLRMRLRYMQAKLDAFRGRYKEAVDENDFMNKKFVEASAKLKEQLAIYGSEVLHLKKQLATR